MPQPKQSLGRRKAIWLSFAVVALAVVSSAATNTQQSSATGTDDQPQVHSVRMRASIACESLVVLNPFQVIPEPPLPELTATGNSELSDKPQVRMGERTLAIVAVVMTLQGGCSIAARNRPRSRRCRIRFCLDLATILTTTAVCSCSRLQASHRNTLYIETAPFSARFRRAAGYEQ